MPEESVTRYVDPDAATPRDIDAGSTGAASIDALLREHGGMVARIAASYEANAELARDLTQEILIAVWRASASFRGACSMRTFVARIAHHRCVSHVARAVRKPMELELGVDLPCAHPSPADLVIADELRSRLAAAVLRLPLAYRQVASLLLEGFSTIEVADALGISANAVAIRSSRARSMLRDLIGTES
jgi:RNA polymerase sigma-70 factor (ECF subfamily)